ncbi:MAG TPA: AAA family ATPase, partial [Myxococcota bacterium]|nr:AAA family ATPase [Myxococcota bacterium]
MGDVELLSSLKSRHQELQDAIGEVVVGQREVVELLLIALLADGHCLFVGVPGLAKTLLVHTVADAVGLGFSRIQFTPDLMPSDITGVEVIDEDPATRQRAFRFVPGPVFTNLLLADEINRTPPKTQAALLQAMQERVVTAAGRTHQLPRPFLVFATQNPIEQEGTYPLPEAQQDRFMFSVHVGYPSEEEEVAIVRRTTRGELGRARRVMTGDELFAYQRAIAGMPDHGDCVELAVRLARRTRPGSGG